MKVLNTSFLFSLKNNHLIFTCCLFVFGSLLISSCNSTESQELTGAETTETSTSETKDNSSSGLSQKGDYSQLFTSDLKDCEFLTIPEFAAAINSAENDIELKENGYDCFYMYTNKKGLVTQFRIHNNPMSKTQLQKEIKATKNDAATLKKGSRLVEVRKSESGDTYLAMGQDRYINLLNDNYEFITNISYNVKFDPNEKNVEVINAQRDAIREKAFAVANALLKKYRK